MVEFWRSQKLQFWCKNGHRRWILSGHCNLSCPPRTGFFLGIWKLWLDLIKKKKIHSYCSLQVSLLQSFRYSNACMIPHAMDATILLHARPNHPCNLPHIACDNSPAECLLSAQLQKAKSSKKSMHSARFSKATASQEQEHQARSYKREGL